jgi:hypothetical protein
LNDDGEQRAVGVRRKEKPKTKGNVSMVEGEPQFGFRLALASLGHWWIRWVKMRRVIRALERPAECREESAEGERIEIKDGR